MSVRVYNVGLNGITIGIKKEILPSIGLNAEYVTTISNTDDYASSIDGSVNYSDPSNVILDTSDVDTANGFTKSIQFIGQSDVRFPLNNPVLYNKEFYFKIRTKLPSNTTRCFLYYHQEPDSLNYDDRLLIGNGAIEDENLNLWNNQQSPVILNSTNVAGSWKTIEFYYNGSNTFQAYVDGVQIYSITYSILDYTNWFNWIRAVFGSGARISYYEAQIEGINWNNPTIGNGLI